MITIILSLLGLGGVGAALAFIPRASELVGKVLSAIPILGWVAIVAVIAAALQWGEARHWRKEYDGQVAGRKADIAAVRKATTEALVRQAGRLIAEERTRTRINQETANAAQIRLAALDARYDRLWRAYRGIATAAPAPALPDATRGFDAEACRDGFLCIPAETAFALMREADRNTGNLIALQDWVRKQAAVDPNVDLVPDGGKQPAN